MTTDAAFMDAVTSRRDLAGWSQGRLAEQMCAKGFAWRQSTVSALECGTRGVALSEAVALAEMFGLTVDQMVGGGGPKFQALESILRAHGLLDALVSA